MLVLVLGMPLFAFVDIRNRLRGTISFRCNESGNVTGCADVLCALRLRVPVCC